MLADFVANSFKSLVIFFCILIVRVLQGNLEPTANFIQNELLFFSKHQLSSMVSFDESWMDDLNHTHESIMYKSYFIELFSFE